MTKKQILMTLWRFVTLVFALYGLALQLLPDTFYNLTYYTLLSNVLVAGFLIWTLLPLLYMVFALVKGYIFRIPIPDQAESPYPYFFLNVDQIGWTGFLGYAIAIFIGYLVLGYGLYFVKRSKHS